uniref:Uncharacterized protein n=1 Tax=Amphiprion percula TaxID=161767 RepID=A0A3P8S8I3_AMPPE
KALPESGTLGPPSGVGRRSPIMASRRSLQSLAEMAVEFAGAGVVVLPNHLADDFEAFCRSNPAPLPLLYRSQSGETSCPPLAKHADISSLPPPSPLLL